MYTRNISMSDGLLARQMERQNKELEKAGLNKDKYILWLICDMYYGFAGVKSGEAYIFTDTGEIYPMQVTRKPYPNKCISQISLSIGRKRTFGVPIEFDSLEDLKKVKNIVIVWDLYCVAYNANHEKINEWTRNMEVYNVVFSSIDDDCHIFELTSKSYCIYDSKRYEKYLEEFNSVQIVTRKPGEKSEYKMGVSLTKRENTFEKACNMLIYPNISRKIKNELDLNTAALAFGVGWKDKNVHKSVSVLTADIELVGKTVLNSFL